MVVLGIERSMCKTDGWLAGWLAGWMDGCRVTPRRRCISLLTDPPVPNSPAHPRQSGIMDRRERRAREGAKASVNVVVSCAHTAQCSAATWRNRQTIGPEDDARCVPRT